MIVELRNVDVSFGEKKVLNELSVKIPKGKITAIIGQSGCGKSTLLKTLNRMCQEEGGEISGDCLLDNDSTLSIPVELLRKRVGMVFQQPLVFPFSVKKNLTYVLNYHFKLTKEEINQRVEELLRQVNLFDELKGELNLQGNKLSGGQKQRLAIARALCPEPELLLLDEPCSALDMENTLQIESLVLKLKEQYSVVVVTHNLAQAKRVSDFIILMDQGQIIEQTSTAQFFKSPQTELGKKYMKYM